MRLKNIALLKRRVRSNVKQDELINWNYIDRIEAGEMKAQVCGIGCLALPHTKKDRLAFYEETVPGRPNFLLYLSATELVKKLGEDFGICGPLARLLEMVFMSTNEASEHPDDAAQFMRDFVGHLPEGADIGPEHVRSLENRLENEGWGVRASHARELLYAWLDNGGRLKGI